MFDRRQFEDLVRRVLLRLAEDMREQRIYSEAAVNLLLGTAAVESQFGTFLRQIRGPALGAFQVEPNTFNWIKSKYGDRALDLIGSTAEQLEWDIRLGIIVARLRYWVDAEPLPEATDMFALGTYWKRVYNSVQGRGNPADFVHAYRRFVL